MKSNIIYVSVVRDYAFFMSMHRPKDRCDVMIYDNRQENIPITQRYNDFIASRPHGEDCWYVLCHEDFEFLEDPEIILEGANRNVVYGSVGITDEWLIVGNHVNCNRDGTGVSAYENPIREPVAVSTVDCCCLIMHSSLVQRIGLRFDENLSWDLYAEDLCICANQCSNISIQVLPIKGRHWSYGKLQPRYYEQLDYLRKKWRGARHVYLTTNMSCIGDPWRCMQKRWQKRLRRLLWHKRIKQDGSLCISVFHVPIWQRRVGCNAKS